MTNGEAGGRAARYSALARIAQGLAAHSPISDDDVGRMQSAGRNVEIYGPGAQLRATAADAGPRAGVILSGWACEQRILLDGRRQVFAFLLPGDPIVIPDDTGSGSRTIVALTRLEFANLSPVVRYGSQPLAEGPPRAFAAAMGQHHDRLFDQIVRIGRQTACERVAHLLLELRDRLDVQGLVKAQSFRIPLTQEVLGDALGLSIVHINRTLRQLRRDGLIELKCGGVTLLKPARLLSIAHARESMSPQAERASQAWSTSMKVAHGG